MESVPWCGKGSICNGYWEVEIAEAGTYRFELPCGAGPQKRGRRSRRGWRAASPWAGPNSPSSTPAESSETGDDCAPGRSWKETGYDGAAVSRFPIRWARIAVAGVEASTEVGPKR